MKKKILGLCVALMLTVAMCACSDSSQTEETEFNGTEMTVGNVCWAMDETWTESFDYDVVGAEPIGETKYIYSDDESCVDAQFFEEGVLVDVDEYLRLSEESNIGKMLDYTVTDTDELGEVAVVIKAFEDTGEYGATIRFNYDGNDYAVYIWTDSNEKVVDFTDQFKNTVRPL